MAILRKEKIPVFQIEDKYVDALMAKDSNNLEIDLSLLLLISSYNIVPPISDLAKLLQREKVIIQMSLKNLVEIGFLEEN